MKKLRDLKTKAQRRKFQAKAVKHKASRRQATAAAQALRPGAKMAEVLTCHQKYRYLSQASAEAAAQTFRPRLYVYRCRICRDWHHTS